MAHSLCSRDALLNEALAVEEGLEDGQPAQDLLSLKGFTVQRIGAGLSLTRDRQKVGITLAVALFGLVMGMLVGTALAVAAWFSAIASGLLNPLTVLFSSVPVVALIPVIARLLGYDTSTVLAIVVIITFFPSFVFASSGLRQPPAGAEDLFRVLGASRLDLLLRLALPSAMPNLAIAFKLAAAHAILALLHHAHIAHEGEASGLQIGAQRHVVDVAGGVLITKPHRVGAPVRIDRTILQSFVA